jgi:hypothetical protein
VVLHEYFCDEKRKSVSECRVSRGRGGWTGLASKRARRKSCFVLYEKSKLDSMIIIGTPAACVFRDYASGSYGAAAGLVKSAAE